ncbi:MAG: HAMP domain-containing sensor histidine kinase [Rariglobus sp.]
MTTTAKDLLSTRVVVVQPEQRLRDVVPELQKVQAQYCVIISSETGMFEGLVRLGDAAIFTGAVTRIFADLAGGASWRSVREDEPADAVLAALGTDHDAVVVVFTKDGRYGGIVTSESSWSWLIGVQAEQKKRLAALFEEQRRLGDFLERKVEQRTASLRLALDEFKKTSAMLSHDAGGPLRTIESFVEMLTSGECGVLNEQGKEHVARILRASTKLQTLAADVLGRAREAGRAAPAPRDSVNLDEVVSDAIELSQAFLNERAAVVNKSSYLHAVGGSYVPLLQIVSNLLVNAVKYVPADRTPLVEIWSEETADGRILLCMKDNGAGIAADELRTVFQPFVRFDSGGKQPGVGLGLSIAQSAVTDLGGAIRLESKVGSGSVFKVELNAAN